ncbi:MAG: metalloregulator ArsR/SmtB family transcription factor [Sporichthyaceae bacterium]|nr:metalloregulator ArsR/SmtB family transcription factor [Sporichthyaceae bacterium]
MQTVVLAALADETRLRIVELLAEADLPSGGLADRFPISRPAISRHLRVLREAGLVRVEARAQQRIYSLDPAPLAELDEWLSHYRQFWSQRLDALETEIARGRRATATAKEN